MEIAILAGGIGAAKFIEGMLHEHPPGKITVIVNVGDDSEMHGLYICPDFDIISYTIAGLIDPVKRWGIEGETFNCLSMLKKYTSQYTWFNLGDKDLGTHIFRTACLKNGDSLSEAASKILDGLGIEMKILPCTNDFLRTRIKTDSKVLEFEEYFVKERTNPVLKEIIFEGAKDAKASEEVLSSLNQAELIIIAPSNPYLSIDPILSISSIRQILQEKKDNVVFISPIVDGNAIKGPTAKVMKEMDIEPSCISVASHYNDISSIAVIDKQDKQHAEAIKDQGYIVHVFDTIMKNIDKKRHLARFVLNILKNKSNMDRTT